jgi:serine/threonine protein phosphatase PrpC
MTAAAMQCPVCAATVAVGDAFCEMCGAELGAESPADHRAESGADSPPSRQPSSATSHPARADDTAPIPRTVITSPACAQCGGSISDDGFCGICGRKASTPRDHWTEQPGAWVAGVCDKGIVHARNEDAMALAAAVDRPYAVLVVCDGVTSAPDSDRASLAASLAACSNLAGVAPPPAGSEAAAVSYWADALEDAAGDAHDAAVGVAHTLGDPPEPPSCTFVAAVVDGSLLSVAWCGDSRAYWLPDGGDAVQMTTDHSLGTELMAAGMTREQAEADPTFHTITRWLGADSVDSHPEIVSLTIDSPGWFLVCSDGLWNYLTAPGSMAALVGQLGQAGAEPLTLAAGLVDYANAAGGHDNITAAVARLAPSLPLPEKETLRG